MHIFISKQNNDFIFDDYHGVTNSNAIFYEGKKYKQINFDIKQLSLNSGFNESLISIDGNFDEAVLKFLLNFELSIDVVILNCNGGREYITHQYNRCKISGNRINENKHILFIKSQHLYNDNIVEYISETCMANFCDLKCGLNEENFKKSGSVSQVVSDYSFKDFSRNEDDMFFQFASLVFTSGQNKGITYDVKNVSSGLITLVQIIKYAIQNGDEYVIKQSCNKTYSACKSFNNQLNFRGF